MTARVAPATVSIEVEEALAGLSTASQTRHRPNPRHVEVIVRNLPLLPPEQLDGVDFHLRATCTREVIACVDEHAIWPLLSPAKRQGRHDALRHRRACRREFNAFSDSNRATLAQTHEEHSATLAQADAMHTGTGIRRFRPESSHDLMQWLRLMGRVVGLPRSRPALYRRPQRRRNTSRSSSGSRRAPAPSPARRRSRRDHGSEPPDRLASPSDHGGVA